MTAVESRSEGAIAEVREAFAMPFSARSAAAPFMILRDVRVGRDGTVRMQSVALVAIHLVSQEDGGYVVLVPGLPGACTQGEDLEDAIAMARESIQGFLAIADPEDFARRESQELHEPGETIMIRVPLDETASKSQSA